jgi:hypothetical protein
MVGNFPQWEKKSLPLHGSFSTAAPVLYAGNYLPLFSQCSTVSKENMCKRQEKREANEWGKIRKRKRRKRKGGKSGGGRWGGGEDTKKKRKGKAERSLKKGEEVKRRSFC